MPLYTLQLSVGKVISDFREVMRSLDVLRSVMAMSGDILWDDMDADVACRQLGFTEESTVHTKTFTE